MKKKKAKSDFVHLHVHSDMSQLDGCAKIPDYVKKAKSMHQPAIALTEHGTMRAYYPQLLECQEHGIKPIYGIEFYVANDMRRKGLTPEEKSGITDGLKRGEWKGAIKDYEDREGIRDRYHLTVWAKNEHGLKNLFKLSSSAWLDGFYYKPRIDIKELIKHKEGLVVATGCLSSIVMDHITIGKRKRALAEADRLYDTFGEDLWLEIMPHSLKEQADTNKFAVELAERWEGKVGLLATQDAHYVEESDWDAHEALLCIGTNDHLHNPDRFKFGNGELWLKSRREMYHDFMANHNYLGKGRIKEALDNTLLFTEKIDNKIIEIDRFACLMPPIDIPKEHADEFRYIRSLCVHGWSWRDIPGRAEVYSRIHGVSVGVALGMYKARLKKELLAIRNQKFIGYFLLVRDLYNWARKQDIMCGPGRGSAAGSIVSYLLGITSVDPIEHNLLFERFISPSRIDMPDIDMDFEDVRRREIINHLHEKYGRDKVCQIATVGKLSGKQCIARGQKVMLASGYEKNIEDIECGDAIVNYDVERKAFKQDEVVAHHSNGLQEVYEVRGENGEVIRATGDHKVLTTVGWKEIRLLQPSDIIVDYTMSEGGENDC